MRPSRAVSDSKLQALNPAARMGLADHPMGGQWACAGCGVRVSSGHTCPDCYTVLCGDCSSREHQEPHGERVGMPCLASQVRAEFRGCATVDRYLDSERESRE